MSRADAARAALREKHDPTEENRSKDSAPCDQDDAATRPLRRRRDAANSLRQLADGSRDPLDRLVPDRRCDGRSARAAWWHLRDHGLMSEHVENLLRRWSS